MISIKVFLLSQFFNQFISVFLYWNLHFESSRNKVLPFNITTDTKIIYKINRNSVGGYRKIEAT
jgi:hypothetical protein